MCYPVKCKKCGKTTWEGCGKHKDMVMAKVPENDRCTCPRDGDVKKEAPKQPESSGSGGGNLVQIKSKEEFDALISGNTLVAVDFFANWCVPCKKMAPIVNLIIFIININ